MKKLSRINLLFSIFQLNMLSKIWKWLGAVKATCTAIHQELTNTCDIAFFCPVATVNISWAFARTCWETYTTSTSWVLPWIKFFWWWRVKIPILLYINFCQCVWAVAASGCQRVAGMKVVQVFFFQWPTHRHPFFLAKLFSFLSAITAKLPQTWGEKGDWAKWGGTLENFI